ncbi:hypothetical protein Gotur_002604 [Gossypium turneri]
MGNCKGIWENATEREWTKFCLPFEEPIIIPVVQEFYLALKQREVVRPFYEMCFLVKVRGVNVPQFGNIDTEEILRILTEGKEMWIYRTGTVIPETFNQELMTPIAKMWMKFVCSRIWLIIEMFDISQIQAIITYGILQKKKICIGTWIYKNMVDCVRNSGKIIFFPHLITELCKRAGVPIERMDKTINTPRKLLGDDLFKQFVLLQTKQKRGKEQKRTSGR